MKKFINLKREIVWVEDFELPQFVRTAQKSALW